MCHKVPNNKMALLSYDIKNRILNHCILIHSDVPFTLVAGLLAKGQYQKDPVTGHLSTGFLGFPVSISEC